jgi:quinol monooxygenase YgiN
MVTFECLAQAGKGKELFETLKDLLPNTRNKEGFIDLVVHVDQDNPDRFLCVQHWEDRQFYESYVKWRKEKGHLNISAKELGGRQLAESPTIRFFDPTDA